MNALNDYHKSLHPFNTLNNGPRFRDNSSRQAGVVSLFTLWHEAITNPNTSLDCRLSLVKFCFGTFVICTGIVIRALVEIVSQMTIDVAKYVAE
jgi:hypothetical protein